MVRYRKKSFVVEAERWTGENWSALNAFTGGHATAVDQTHRYLTITSPDGKWRMGAAPGDWIIKGGGGELAICPPDLFEELYEAAELSERE